MKYYFFIISFLALAPLGVAQELQWITKEDVLARVREQNNNLKIAEKEVMATR